VRLWVDNGVRHLAYAADWLALQLGDLVLGSESQSDAGLLRALAGDARIVLSLDFRGGEFQGPPALLADAAAWPRRVIVMTLARVGTGAGPDLERLAHIQTAADGRRVYAAGGVRDAADLAQLKRRGIAGALIATSLHDGRLSGSDIAAL
jgi:phosphoribosylformimino-5-aminoimidazole carboxamide ribotide isomerase